MELVNCSCRLTCLPLSFHKVLYLVGGEDKAWASPVYSLSQSLVEKVISRVLCLPENDSAWKPCKAQRSFQKPWMIQAHQSAEGSIQTHRNIWVTPKEEDLARIPLCWKKASDCLGHSELSYKNSQESDCYLYTPFFVRGIVPDLLPGMHPWWKPSLSWFIALFYTEDSAFFSVNRCKIVFSFNFSVLDIPKFFPNPYPSSTK